MGTTEDSLITSAYWESREFDLRLNPLLPNDWEGLESYLSKLEALAGHVIFATSGSSGEPKLICLSRDALLASARIVNAHFSATPEDRWLCALPTFHVGGFGIWARAYASGANVQAYEGKWRAERFREQCEQSGTTLTSLVPVQVYDLVDKAQPCPETLRAVIVGGGQLATELGRRARDLGWPVLQSYGMTETASQVATQAMADLEKAFVHEPIALLEGWRARLSGDDRLELSGPGLFSGLIRKVKGEWRYEEARISIEDGEPWYSTEDLGAVETREGRQELKVQGRRGRVLKILGELVSMDRLEEVLQEVAALDAQRVTLHAAPHPRNGHEVVLVAEPTVDEERVERFIESFNLQVAPFERITRWVQIDQIPRGALGKVQRPQLADWFASRE